MTYRRAHRIRNIVNVSVLLVALPLAAHNGMREIQGTIARIDSAAIVVTRTDGTDENVALGEATVFKIGKERGTAADMRVGSRVAVHFGHDGKALEIHLPARR